MTPYDCPDHGHWPPWFVPWLLTTHSCSWPEGLLILLPSHDAAWHLPVPAQHLPTHAAAAPVEVSIID